MEEQLKVLQAQIAELEKKMQSQPDKTEADKKIKQATIAAIKKFTDKENALNQK